MIDFRKISENICDFFFPPKCVSCGEYLKLSQNRAFCRNCRLIMDNARRTLPLENRDPNVRSCFCLYDYSDDTVRGAVFNMKYRGNYHLCNYLARQMYENVRFRGLMRLVDIVTFAPRRKTEKRRSGHDQAQLLAKALSEKMGVDYSPLIERRGISKKQRSLGESERRENVKGKFKCNIPLDGKNILLIDDVITTGSTVSECARVLKAAGAGNIYVIGVAH